MIDADSRFKQCEHVLRQEISGSVVLFNMESGQYYSLNEVGTRAWELCDGARSVSEILAILVNEYDAPETTIREDVLKLFVELADEHLLREVLPAA